MILALDMMGGDFAPLEAVKGVKLYLRGSNKAIVYCIGDDQQLNTLFAEHQIPQDRVKIIHTSQVVGYHEHPTKALKDKPDSSISKGFELLASGKADAFLSSG